MCVEVGGSQGILVTVVAAAAAKSPQSCPTLCDPIDGINVCVHQQSYFQV